ncbi:hypothetical protein F9K88_00250 [Brucella intermedia]|uniref:hypothetical protein n=1 Tax=Brucella intermedia TaxID=94625 RepID=UPI00124EAD7D|nr:hypothetical protein [Brucella intermedia]KAB2714066.1 hypothetical protein F9K88_00250 [Brucella intermedia]
MGAAIFDRILLLLLSALAAFITLVPMAELGWFGSSFEGSSGYLAMFVAFPILTAILAVLAVRYAPRPLPKALRIAGASIIGLVYIVFFVL